MLQYLGLLYSSSLSLVHPSAMQVAVSGSRNIRRFESMKYARQLTKALNNFNFAEKKAFKFRGGSDQVLIHAPALVT